MRNTINRTAVPNDPEKNMNAAEDFLLLVHAHVTAAAKVLQMQNSTTEVTALAECIIESLYTSPT